MPQCCSTIRFRYEVLLVEINRASSEWRHFVNKQIFSKHFPVSCKRRRDSLTHHKCLQKAVNTYSSTLITIILVLFELKQKCIKYVICSHNFQYAFFVNISGNRNLFHFWDMRLIIVQYKGMIKNNMVNLAVQRASCVLGFCF